MEYWEHTKERAIATLAAWEAHIPTFKVNGLLPAVLEAMIDGFEPKAQERTTAQDTFDAAVRAA